MSSFVMILDEKNMFFASPGARGQTEPIPNVIGGILHISQFDGILHIHSKNLTCSGERL